MSKMIRLSDTASAQLEKIANETHETKQSLLDKAIDMLARRFFLEKTNAQYAALKKDSEGWKEELEERELWDVTLLDGLNKKNNNGK